VTFLRKVVKSAKKKQDCLVSKTFHSENPEQFGSPEQFIDRAFNSRDVKIKETAGAVSLKNV